MGGNPTDAEDALSRAMLKAWEKVQKIGVEIDNFKSWLSTLTHNLCVDIQRERSRGANRVEDIELYASSVEQGLVSFEDTPESAMETGEKRIVIRRAIDNLPSRLRETFILHFYRELPYQEIAQQQEISYQNVCKRISQARKILREELRGYFIGEDGTDTDKSVPPTATESAIGEMSQKNAPVKAIVGETVTLSEAVEEVENVVGEESIEVARSGEACCLWQSVQHSESVTVVATSDGRLEVKSDGCWCVEIALCERQFAPILANAQFEEETGSWGNSCLAVLWMQQQPLVGKVAGEVLRSSRSPPLYRLSYFQSCVKSLLGMMMKGKFILSQISANLPYSKRNFWRCLMAWHGRTVWIFAICWETGIKSVRATLSFWITRKIQKLLLEIVLIM
jgi:RNA polymerase sigma-70 factor (ECF subfamily)